MNKVKKAFYRAGCIAMQALYAVGRFFKKLWQHKQGRIGLIIVAVLYHFDVKGYILIGILATWIMGMVAQAVVVPFLVMGVRALLVREKK